MFQTMYDISMGARAGVLNRIFTVAMLLLVLIQIGRWLHFRIRLTRWRYRFHLLEQEAREEGVVTITEASALPPTNPYTRFWEMLPSMAIMFGLLGTFVGLTLSLSELPVTGDVEAIQKGLSRSIPSMGTAFWTSLSGLLVALAVRITNAAMSSDFRKHVIKTLLQSEPAVIEALEETAFQTGQDGALLRPHGIRELLWHQNRLLNQTIARVAPQVSEGISRGLSHIAQGTALPAPTPLPARPAPTPQPESDAFPPLQQSAPAGSHPLTYATNQQLERLISLTHEFQQEQRLLLQSLLEQQQAAVQQLHFLANLWSQHLHADASPPDQTADLTPGHLTLEHTSVGTPSPFLNKKS
jgi:hypothetical protein